MYVHYKIWGLVLMLSQAAATSDPAEPAVQAVLFASALLKRNLVRPAMRAYSNFLAASSWSTKGCLANQPSRESSDA